MEIHVLSILRRKKKIPLPDLRRSIESLKEFFNHPHPLAHIDFKVGGKEIFIEKAGMYISTTRKGQAGLPGIIDRILERIVYEENELASELYLFTRPNILSSDVEQPKSRREEFLEVIS